MPNQHLTHTMLVYEYHFHPKFDTSPNSNYTIKGPNQQLSGHSKSAHRLVLTSARSLKTKNLVIMNKLAIIAVMCLMVTMTLAYPSYPGYYGGYYDENNDRLDDR